MCSVIGYVGKNNGKRFILEGLTRLEYRGYDSAGVAFVDQVNNNIAYAKAVGGLSSLHQKIASTHSFSDLNREGSIGIGHSRWATHGNPTEVNAHPHIGCQKTLAVVHNGIIENYFEIKKELERKGHFFVSDTDTEVIVHLYEELSFFSNTKDSDIKDRIKDTIVELISKLHGAYTFILVSVDNPDTLILVKSGPPLCIGIGNGELFVASDAYAFAGHTDMLFFLPDKTFAFVKKDGFALYDFQGNERAWQSEVSHVVWETHDKQGYEHFMLKEIYEQKAALYKTISYLNTIHGTVGDYIGLSLDKIGELEGVHLVGCGASWYAGRIGQFFFESIARIPCLVSLASEFRYMPFFPSKNRLHIAISQSGETADTLEALNLIKMHGLSTMALTNVATSSIVRQADGFVLTQAGREIAVASTKGFSTQIAVLYWLAHRIAFEKKSISAQEMERVYTDLLYAADVLESAIGLYKEDIVKHHAPKYAFYTKIICLGRNGSYPFAMEAALKLKEIAYIFAQCYPAGELKHGSLALIDEHIPVFIFSHQDALIYQKILSNAYEVKARKGHIVAFLFEGQIELSLIADLFFVIPRVAPLLGELAMTGLMQFFIYSIARELGHPIDNPRNLAKSVTVE